MKKRILSLILALLMMGTPAAYAEGTASDTESETVQESVPAAEVVITEVSQDNGNTEQGIDDGTAVPEEKTDLIVEDINEDLEDNTSENAVKSDEKDDENAQEGNESDEVSNSEETPVTDPDKYERRDEDERIYTMTLKEPVDKQGEISSRTISIKSIELGNMPTNGYQYLMFTFSDPDDGTLYEGYLAGVKVYTADNDTHTESVNDKIVKLVTDVADHFYAGQSIKLSDEKEFAEKYGLVVNPIDTEKVNSNVSSDVTKSCDTQLCWAASASDMIEFSNWNDHINESEPALEDEDAVFDYFEDSFTDVGSLQDFGIKWFMNGTNHKENTLDDDVLYYNTKVVDNTVRYYCYDSEGEVVYYHYTGNTDVYENIFCNGEDEVIFYYKVAEREGYGNVMECFDPNGNVIFFYNGYYYYNDNNQMIPTPGVEYGIDPNWAQEKITTADNKIENKNGNLVSDYAEETVGNITYATQNGYDNLYEAAMDLKNETATGVGIYFYDERNTPRGGHAITLLGYVKDVLEEGWKSLKALFMTDSDNDKCESTTRSGAIDSVTMYETNAVTLNTGGMSREILYLSNYTDMEGYTTPILNYSTLKAYSDSCVKETEGTKDAVNTIDYAVTNFDAENDDGVICDEFDQGEEIYLWTTVANTSYKHVDIEKDHPYWVISYKITCNGEVIDNIENKVPIRSEMDVCSDFPCYLETAYTLEKSGNYSVSVCLKGIYSDDEDGNAHKLAEAYTTNNTIENYTFTVKGKDTPDHGGDKEKETVISGTTKSIPTYSIYFDTLNPSSCMVEMQGLKEKVATVKLNGNVIDAENYTISYADDGTATITFTQEFMKTLLPGEYTFRLMGESGSVIACVVITVK